MGIYLPNMEMPIFEHQSWDICKGTDGKWYMVDNNAETSDGAWHEIVPVPPHGRLIDADALAEYVHQQDDWLSEVSIHAFCGILCKAPTIIPAEADEEQREYEMQVEDAQYCEMYEPTYDPETGAL